MAADSRIPPGLACDSLLHTRLLNAELGGQRSGTLAHHVARPALPDYVPRELRRRMRFTLEPVALQVSRNRSWQPSPGLACNRVADQRSGQSELLAQRTLGLTGSIPPTNLCYEGGSDLGVRVLLTAVVRSVSYAVHGVLRRCTPPQVDQPVVKRTPWAVQRLVSIRARTHESFEHNPGHQVNLMLALTAQAYRHVPSRTSRLQDATPATTSLRYSAYPPEIRHLVKALVAQNWEPLLFYVSHTSSIFTGGGHGSG